MGLSRAPKYLFPGPEQPQKTHPAELPLEASKDEGELVGFGAKGSSAECKHRNRGWDQLSKGTAESKSWNQKPHTKLFISWARGFPEGMSPEIPLEASKDKVELVGFGAKGILSYPLQGAGLLTVHQIVYFLGTRGPSKHIA